MEKSAESVSERKFVKMSAKRRHQLLIQLAQAALEREDHAPFWDRYHQMTGWSEMDRFRPPSHLEPHEAVHQLIRFHQVLAGPELPAQAIQRCDWQPTWPVTVVLDGVRTPYNLGSALRLIDNFGFAELCHGSPHLRTDHPQLARAARGAQGWIPMRCEVDMADWLAGETRPVIGLETGPDAVPIHLWEPPPACILVFGNEEHGISRAVRDQLDQQIVIPMFGFKNSMNLTHALAVAGSWWLQKNLKNSDETGAKKRLYP